MSSRTKNRELEIGWWQLLPLAERDHRPVVWSASSAIFSAHRTKPRVVGRHFPSLKAFELPSPLNQSLNPYEPPTHLCVSPDGGWLFAYFPGQEFDGLACVWSKGVEADDWTVKESWSVARGAGVVTGTWLSSYRQWVVFSSGFPRRMPPCGPSLPVSYPLLLLVTQTLQVELWYMRANASLFNVLRTGLNQPNATIESTPQPSPLRDGTYNPGGVKTCVSAAIGVGYNEPSVLVAMRTYMSPPPTKVSSDHTMNLNFPLNMPSHDDATLPDAGPSNDWELWGEEPLIQLSEVQIHFDSLIMSLTTRPLPPIMHPEPCLSSLTFIPSLADPSRPKDSTETTSQPSLRLAANFINFGDYSSTPQTTLVLYSLIRNESMTNAPWSVQLAASRIFTENPLAFVVPVIGTPNLLAGLLNVNEPVPRKKTQAKEVVVGKLITLELNNLSTDDTWESSDLLASTNGAGIILPLNGIISPNNTLVCCTSPSADMSSPISIQSAPCRKISGGPFLRSSCALVSSLYGRSSPADVVHILAKPSSSLDHVTDVLLGVLNIVDKQMSGTRRTLFRELLGMEVEIYRTKARYAEGELLKDMNGRWQTGHDLCTISAYNSAFEDCREADSYTYDLESAWQLVCLSNWIMEFFEKLMKECILFAGPRWEQDGGATESVRDDLFGPASSDSKIDQTPIPHILLNLIHPYGLATLHTALNHIKHFRGYLGSMAANVENTEMVKDVLIDLVDCSGIDLFKLESLIVQFGHEVKLLAPEALHVSLVCCRPDASLGRILRTFANKIVSSQVVDKARLFIKPSDLMDGVSRISLSEASATTERDIISKCVLSQHSKQLVCCRCGGKTGASSAKVPGHVLSGWNAWERLWTYKCICGGFWSSVRMS